eukprot:scaffold130219_cov48-Phaeocystis_antarctica.AAC.2
MQVEATVLRLRRRGDGARRHGRADRGGAAGQREADQAEDAEREHEHRAPRAGDGREVQALTLALSPTLTSGSLEKCKP